MDFLGQLNHNANVKVYEFQNALHNFFLTKFASFYVYKNCLYLEYMYMYHEISGPQIHISCTEPKYVNCLLNKINKITLGLFTIKI